MRHSVLLAETNCATVSGSQNTDLQPALPMPKKKANSNSAKSKSPEIRLQRFLAQSGLGSRRECEDLITEGRVTIDGQVVSKLGSRVAPDCLKVRMDGTRVMPTRFQYFVVHKPTGVLSTCRDPEGRTRVIDLIKTDQRVYNVGRLDKSSEGLILVTNDGDLANRLTHPRYGVQKTYHVTVVGNPRWEDLQMLKRGIRLAEAVAQVSDVKIRTRRRDTCELEMVLEEGRNREIRRLLAHIGHKVTRLRRVAIGPLKLGNLKAGDYRRLEKQEIQSLRSASSVVKEKKPRRSRPVETSQLSGQRKRKALNQEDSNSPVSRTGKGKRGERKPGGARTSEAKKLAGKKSVARNPEKKKSSKKKRPPTTASRRGAGRMIKTEPRKKTGRSVKTSSKRTGSAKKKTARTRKSAGSRSVMSKGRSGSGRRK